MVNEGILAVGPGPVVSRVRSNLQVPLRSHRGWSQDHQQDGDGPEQTS